jgi:TRAP-type transport system periplasmic protein
MRYQPNLRKTLGGAVVTAALLLGLPASGQEAKTARLGHAMPAGHPQAVAMAKLAELVDARTNGRIKITVFDGGQLGGDDKQYQAVQAGVQDFFIGGVAPLSGRVKEVKIFDFPFLFEKPKEVAHVLNGPIGKKILDKMEGAGLVGIGWANFGFRQLSNSKHEVKKAEDISGLKLRVMQNPVALDSWKALGANAVPMSFSEVFTALETKALDGQENPLQHMYSNKMFEVQKYVTLTSHVYTPSAMVASPKFWKSISAQDQDIIRQASQEAFALQAKLVDEGDAEAAEKMKQAGMVLTEIPAAELTKMKEKVKPVIEKYTQEIGPDFVREFYAEIEKARASN